MNKLVYTQDVKQVIKDLPVTLDAETVQRAIEAVDKAPEAKLPNEIAAWIWDPNGLEWHLGAWVCSKCRKVNKNIECGNDELPKGPYEWTGSKFCPNCGRKMVKGPSEPPTAKQMEFIEDIEEFVDERFTGSTMDEASDYISRNIQKFQLEITSSWALQNGYF